MTERERLEQAYPEIPFPMRCENGCGTVIAVIDAFRSYERNADGEPKLICECCASEIGHMDEANEEHDEAPKCKRRPKVQ